VGAGGAARVPLDPTKLRERTRASMPGFAYAGIVPIYVGEIGMSGNVKGLTSTVEQTTLAAGAHEVRGTLFFDLEGAPGQPVRIDISYEDLVTHASAQATAAYAARVSAR
jgi:hypothetical protein